MVNQQLRTTKQGIMELFENQDFNYVRGNCGTYQLEDKGDRAYFCFHQKIRVDGSVPRGFKMGCSIKLSQTCGKVKVYINDKRSQPTSDNKQVCIDGTSEQRADMKLLFIPR